LISKSLESWWEYLTGPEFWIIVSKTTLKIIIIIIIALVIVRIGKRIINHLFNKRAHSPIKISEKREETIRILLQSVLTYAVYFIAIVMILESLNIKISALLAGAGIAGLAIGFGAQSLVKDIISGFFIIFENQFSVDDYVVVADAEGTVEEIGLRTTKIRSWTGEENVIPNGNITQVINYSVHNGLSVVDVNIPYETDIYAIEKSISQLLAKLPQKYDFFVDVPIIHGVQTLDLSNYVIRIIADTKPVYQWAGERAIRKEVQDQLYKDGINIPFQKFVVYSNDKLKYVPNDIRRRTESDE